MIVDIAHKEAAQSPKLLHKVLDATVITWVFGRVQASCRNANQEKMAAMDVKIKIVAVGIALAIESLIKRIPSGYPTMNT